MNFLHQEFVFKQFIVQILVILPNTIKDLWLQVHLGWVKLRGKKIALLSANPKPRCGKGYKVPEIKPTFLGN